MNCYNKTITNSRVTANKKEDKKMAVFAVIVTILTITTGVLLVTDETPVVA